MGPVPWTRLEGTDLWREAQTAYALPPGRTYHSFGHVLRLYKHAARTFHLPYVPALDLAVLAHDARIEGPGAEAHSLTWLLTRQDLVRKAWSNIGTSEQSFERLLDQAGKYILATERHIPTLSTAPMVLLDLADFLDAEVSRANTAMLRKEAKALWGWDETTWTEQTRSYLAELSASLALGLYTSREGTPVPVLPLTVQDQIRAVRAGVDRVADELRTARPCSQAR